MNVEWFKKNSNGVATIYNSYITLNTIAANNFKNAYGTIIGFNIEDNSLVIRAITKEEVSLGLYNNIDIHTISIKPSYGRITGKNIINKLCDYFPLDFTSDKLNKFQCEWFEEESMLKIYLERRVS